MTELRIIALDRVGLALVGQRLMLARVVDEVRGGGQLVGVVLSGGGRGIEQGLEPLRLAVRGDVVGDDAAAGAVSLRDEVDALFFCPSYVYNSSNSTTGSSGYR